MKSRKSKQLAWMEIKGGQGDSVILTRREEVLHEDAKQVARGKGELHVRAAYFGLCCWPRQKPGWQGL